MNAGAAFTVYPAIDLRAGRVVRLQQGDPLRETGYSGTPLQIAQQWLAAGAAWLHVVNLDGAFGDDGAANALALASILRSGARVQFGGGLRTLPAIEQALQLGVERVVLGTVAATEPALVAAALAQFGAHRIAAGIDARAGEVRIKGWAAGTGGSASALAATLQAQGVRTIIFTDVERDGMQQGLNLSATCALAQSSGLQVIASGGVQAASDVHAARAAGLAGVIVGRALYEGQVQLPALLRELAADDARGVRT